MNRLIYIVLVGLVLSSCSPYQKAINSEDIAVKFKVGEDMYNKEKYMKASRLFEQIMPQYRGKPQAEKLSFLHADSYFKSKEYYLAGYQFDRFAAAYPKSEKAEEAEFLSAKSSYMLSPLYTKEQHATKDAIEKFQLFINAYPESPFLEEANKLVHELDGKLEQKSFDIAYQYYKTVEYTRDYNAAIKAFDNFIFEFPGSKLRETALFYRLDSAYNLAINSVERKKEDRLVKAKTYYLSFVNKYTNSEYIDDTKNMLENLEEELKKYSTKS
ncbi:outer membrane protein assembly factor BamD [Lacinutrix himadriensis]|uniref:outer membrane protein assembly factor BamD n=1 Tax=Lacinutrix himadriensis TaxID=641549 RepID=UPI0006E29FEE|nr:outer membrane protein assembly factor BamD [Lacinutrix himadriensis]